MMAFTKILVANRGEIAWRVMRTAKAMGYRTVAVYSDADQDAPHVAFADEAVRIGPPPVERELSQHRPHPRGRAQVRAPTRSIRATASCPRTKPSPRPAARPALVFIGPPPAAIAAMGNKAAAKRRMIDAGVPCVPGYQGSRPERCRPRGGGAHDRPAGDGQGRRRRRRTRHAPGRARGRSRSRRSAPRAAKRRAPSARAS